MVSDVPENMLATFGRRTKDLIGKQSYYRKTGRSVQVGENALASGDSAVALGAFSYAGEDESVAGGMHARAEGKQASVWGNRSQAKGNRSTHVGQGGLTSGIDSTSIGQNAQNTGVRSTLAGCSARISGDDSIGIGVDVVVTHDDCIIIGNRQVSTDDDQIIIATDGNTALRVDSDGAVFVNEVEVGELFTPNSAESATASITVSNTSGTWSAWTTAHAATAAKSIRTMLGIITGLLNGTGRFEFQIATGAAAAEVNLLGGHTFYIGVLANETRAENLEFTMEVAAGTRVSVRARQIDGTGVTGNCQITVTMLEVV